jgi:hypothetical protein
MAGKSRFRLTPLTVATVSAIFSAMALIASAIGTWVAWNARDDYLESVALNEAVTRCASAVATASEYHRTLSAVAADFGAMTPDNAAEVRQRLSAGMAHATELSDGLADDLMRLELAQAMRFPGEPSPFSEMRQRSFDLFTEFNGAILISTDPAALPAALEPVLARIEETGPDIFSLCTDLASRR